MAQKKRVGIWIRVSTDKQVEDESPEHHEKRARLYAEAKGWEVTEIYRLDGLSGKSTFDLPIAKTMLRDLQSGHIEALVFSKLARLGRNTKELLEFSDIFQKAGGDLISLAESIDTSSPAGRMFFTIIAALAQWEREEIAARVAASVPIRAQLGKPLGGAAPYGYTWKGDEIVDGKEKNKKLVINQEEAPVLKLMYELFTEHKRKKTVGRLLNEKGFRTRNGSEFSDTTVGRLLRDSTPKGERIANYTKSLGDGKAWVVKPESEWVRMPCPAIIPETLWEECNRILDQQEKTRKKPVKKAVHLFTGIVFCDCGGKMLVPSDSKKYICNLCKNRIAMDDLEEIYYGNLKSYLMTDENIEKFLSRANATISEKEQRLDTMQQEAKRLQAEMDKTMQLYLDGEIPKEGFGKYYNPLDQQLKQIEIAVPDIQAEIDFLKIEFLNSDLVIKEAQNLYDRWPTIIPEEKRSIVEDITERITVGKEEILFKFSYNPAYFLNSPDWQHNRRGS